MTKATACNAVAIYNGKAPEPNEQLFDTYVTKRLKQKKGYIQLDKTTKRMQSKHNDMTNNLIKSCFGMNCKCGVVFLHDS